MGEEKANADTVDVSRLQNVVITGTLVLGYLLGSGRQMTIDAAKVIGAKQAIFAALPDVNATFASLLLVSHATYLVSEGP